MSRDRGTDWSEILARLDRVDAAVHEALNPSPERVGAILEERARALARIPPRHVSASEVIDVAVFLIAGESYAVETRQVRRIVRPDACTPVPGAPGALLGLINVTGEILAVFDLPAAFGLPRSVPCAGAFVIVLGVDRDEFGVSADAVLEVRALGAADLLEAPGAAEGIGRRIARGLTADAVLVLDGAALLRDDRFVIDQGEDAGG